MEFATLARRQAGVFTRRQAVACGVSPQAVDAALRSGRWRSAYDDHRGVLVDATTPDTYELRLWAAILVIGEPCAVAVDSAAALWNWCSRPTHVTIVVPPSRRPRPPQEVSLRRLAVRHGDVTTRGSVPVTTPVRTLVDCLRFLPRDTATDVLDRSQQHSRAPSLQRVSDQVSRAGAGTAQARSLLRAADGSLFAAERLAVKLLRARGVTGWTANWRTEIQGVVVVVDLAFRDIRLAIEIDGFAFHSSPERFRHDRVRQNALVSAGWMVLRFTWADLTRQPEKFVADVVQAIGQRSVRLLGGPGVAGVLGDEDVLTDSRHT